MSIWAGTRLENGTCKQPALTVDAQQRLYPKTVNEAIIHAARIEVLRRKANGEVSFRQHNIDMRIRPLMISERERFFTLLNL